MTYLDLTRWFRQRPYVPGRIQGFCLPFCLLSFWSNHELGNRWRNHALMALILFGSLFPDLTVAESNSGVFLEGDPKTIVLGKGEYLLLPRRAALIIHNASGKLLKITDEGRNLRLLGKSYGDTSISLGPNSIRVVVTTPQQRQLAQQINSYLTDRPGLRLSPNHPCHLISGELLRWSDWVHLREMAVSAQSCFQFNATIAPEIRQDVQQKILSSFQSSQWGLPEITAENPLTISFPDSAKANGNELEKRLQEWGLKIHFSPQTVDIKPMIRTKILVAEVNRNYARSMGISWPGTYQAQLVPQVAIKNDWEIQLQALESQGKGKILANPSLLSRSGEQAEFLAGGEIPFQMTHRKSQQIVWKKYGISVNVIPQTDQRGYLKVELNAEVSSPDLSLSSNGLPSLKTHRVKSHFNLTQPRTIAISGLLKEDQSQSRSGLPFLSRIPIFGALFSSQQFLQSRSELIILVTPSLINEAAETYSLPEGWSSDS